MNTEKMREVIIKFLYYCLILGAIYFVITFVFPVIMPFLVALFIAFILQPLIRAVTKKTKASQTLIAVLILIAFYCLFVTFFILVGSQVIVYFTNLFAGLPSLYYNQIEPALTQALTTIENFFVQINPSFNSSFMLFDDSTITSSLSSLISSISSEALGLATSFATSVPTGILEALMTVISSFFFVTGYSKIVAFILKILPENIRNTVIAAKSRGLGVMLRFLKAYAILLSITCVELIIGYSLLGVESAFLLAVITALVDILPVLGTGTILIPWGIVSLILGNLPLGIGLLIIYAIITVVRQILEPRIVGSQIGLYPLVTLICMFVGLQLFGFLGLIGLPILVTLIVQLNRSGDLKWF